METGTAKETEMQNEMIGATQLMSIKLLVTIANGDLDAIAAAKAELASRGLDLTGNWVGF